jgi:hypothetical protein
MAMPASDRKFKARRRRKRLRSQLVSDRAGWDERSGPVTTLYVDPKLLCRGQVLDLEDARQNAPADR